MRTYCQSVVVVPLTIRSGNTSVEDSFERKEAPIGYLQCADVNWKAAARKAEGKRNFIFGLKKTVTESLNPYGTLICTIMNQELLVHQIEVGNLGSRRSLSGGWSHRHVCHNSAIATDILLRRRPLYLRYG